MNRLPMLAKDKLCAILVWVVLLVAAAGLKIAAVLANAVPFNSDEAIVGLMARHILSGERPIFFYGQAYMGSLDAILVAIGFKLFGDSVSTIRLVQGSLYLLTIITSIKLGEVLFKSRRAGLITGALLAFPTVNMTLYTTASLGGYGETLLIGSLILLVTWKLKESLDTPTPNHLTYGIAVLLGFLIGLGFWANALTVVYSLPAMVCILVRGALLPKGNRALWWVVLLILGAIVGAFPWMSFAFSHAPGEFIGELLGSAVAVEQGSFLAVTASHILSLVALGIPVVFGLRAPWNVAWILLPVIPLVLTAWGLIIRQLHSLQKLDPVLRSPFWLIIGCIITLIFGFLFTSFGVDPSGRYFLPVTHLLTLLAGVGISRGFTKPIIRYGILAAIIMYQLGGNIQAIIKNPPGLTTQFDASAQVNMEAMPDLIEFLNAQNETKGYSNYWVSYPLAYLSHEKITYIPALPYHPDFRYTARDNRYPAYNGLVDSSPKAAYITTLNPQLDKFLNSWFYDEGIDFKETQIGDFHIFYNLSHKITPDSMAWPVN